MNAIDEVLRNNETYAAEFSLENLPAPPGKKLAVLTCMDARIAVEDMLGLSAGDAHIIRNAGGVVSVDALRSLLISHYLLGTHEWMVINHTDCGMLGLRENEMLDHLRIKTGRDAAEPSHFHAFDDLEENLRLQLEKVRSHPWVPEEITVRGFVFDVKSGRLNELK